MSSRKSSRPKLAFRSISLLLLLSSILPLTTFANTNSGNGNIQSQQKPLLNNNISASDYSERKWAISSAFGLTSTKTLGQTISGKFTDTGERLYSVELEYLLDKNNWLRRLFQSIVPQVKLAGNISYRNGGDNTNAIFEFSPFLFFRWTNFPWNHYVKTSLAIGEGISYATDVPEIEKQTADDYGRLLNYLAFEAAFARPQSPDLELFLRIHHRSGAFGLYGAGNSGSNTLMVGLRYQFDHL